MKLGGEGIYREICSSRPENIPCELYLSPATMDHLARIFDVVSIQLGSGAATAEFPSIYGIRLIVSGVAPDGWLLDLHNMRKIKVPMPGDEE